jgi:hypothetical protein
MKITNSVGSRLIGQIGGKNGNNPGNINTCIKILTDMQAVHIA